jgi:transcriptional regulator with XRE-family HTH domain
MMTIGEKIRQLREDKDLSLRELAKTIGVSAAFFSDVELGRRYPSDKHLAAIARALDTTLDELQAYDTRPPMRALRRMTLSNPQYGLAFRQLIDHNISPQELLDFIKERRKDDEEAEDEQ